MKNQLAKKLCLGRETIVPLQAGAMDGVIGGAGHSHTCQFCGPTNDNARTCGLCIPDNKHQ